MFCSNQLWYHNNNLSLSTTSTYRAPTNDLLTKLVDLKAQFFSQASNSRRMFDALLKILAFNSVCDSSILWDKNLVNNHFHIRTLKTCHMSGTTIAPWVYYRRFRRSLSGQTIVVPEVGTSIADTRLCLHTRFGSRKWNILPILS